MDYLTALNPMQQQAVLHGEGPLLIFAGAGSGKTRVLTYRIAHLIENGIKPYNIIAITFTNKAAREMRERVDAVTPLGGQVWVATFHSACVRILRREITKIGYDNRFSIFDTSDSERLLKECLNELNLDDKYYPVRHVANIISNQKNELVSPQAFTKLSAGNYQMSNIAEAYELYQRKLLNNNALDFDDIIFRTVEVFETQPDVLEQYQERFRYVLVDEYQDTNAAQYRLTSLMAGKWMNLCVVGDDDQSIYGWRGANIQNILNFERDFPQATVIKLEQNYRSTQAILEAANAVINNNFTRSKKSLWTENGYGEKIKVHRAYNEGAEGVFVADTIKQGVVAGGNYSDYAILYRNNAQSRAVEDRLVLMGVPYRLYGGVRFYERMEVKDVLAYLKALDNPADDMAWTRIINVPRRGIGDKTIERIRKYAADSDMPFSDALHECDMVPGLNKKSIMAVRGFMDIMDKCSNYVQNVTELIQQIFELTDYLNSLIDGTEEGTGRIENAKELLSKAYEFESQRDKNERGLSAFLEEVALVADIDNHVEGAETVSLMTLHSAKGLEFSNVFIVGFEEGIFPSYRAVTSDGPDGLEEERRLCYVGITRARNQLYLTSAVTRMQHGHSVSNSPSRFLKELPPHSFEKVSEKSTALKQSFSNKPSGMPKPLGESNPYRENIPVPRDKKLEFEVGDRVRQMKYGTGIVKAIDPAGADFEVTVLFDRIGEKKIMAHLSRLKKV